MIGFIALYTLTNRNYRQLQRYRYSTHFSVHRYTLGFSVFTSRILATDLSQSHCHFKSHMKSSCHSLTHFLPFCSCQFRRLDSFQFLLDYLISKVLSSTPASTPPQATFSTPLQTLGTDHTENTVFYCRKMCLLIRCLAMGVLLSRARVLRECVYRHVA
jgi:hypothetical protein